MVVSIQKSPRLVVYSAAPEAHKQNTVTNMAAFIIDYPK